MNAAARELKAAREEIDRLNRTADRLEGERDLAQQRLRTLIEVVRNATGAMAAVIDLLSAEGRSDLDAEIDLLTDVHTTAMDDDAETVRVPLLVIPMRSDSTKAGPADAPAETGHGTTT